MSAAGDVNGDGYDDVLVGVLNIEIDAEEGGGPEETRRARKPTCLGGVRDSGSDIRTAT